MTSYRIPGKGRADQARPLRFSFNGDSYNGFQGDTLASALLANGVPDAAARVVKAALIILAVFIQQRANKA